MNPRRTSGVYLAGLTLALATCTPGSVGPGPATDAVAADVAPAPDAVPALDGRAPSDAAAAAEDAPAGPPPAPFVVTWRGRGRRPDNLGALDNWQVGSDGAGHASLSEVVRAAGGPAGGCAHGCVVGDEAIAVALGSPDAAEGATWQIGFRHGPGWGFPAGVTLEGAVTLRLAGPLFYARPLAAGAAGGSRQYELRRRDLGTDEDVALFRFPPDGHVAGSLFRGAFHVTPGGGTIALLRPTLRSQWLYVWDEGSGALRRVDEACWRTLGGSCEGAGGFYADDDPLALAPDGRQVAWFVVTEGALEVRVVDLVGGAAGDVRRSAVLTAVAPGQDWTRDACTARAPGQPLAAGGGPRLVDGGATLLFVGRADCDPAGKPETDVYALDVARLGARTPLAASDLRNLTGTLRSGGPEQLVIADLAVARDERTLVFTATPAVTLPEGAPLSEGSSRHTRDTELWVQPRAGGPARQLTDDGAFTAESPTALRP